MLKFFAILAVCLFSLTPAYAQENSLEGDDMPKYISLPKPNISAGTPLMEALNNRKTIRNFSVRKINEQNLSEILWAANGINREDGKRTIPTARDSRDLDVYVIKQVGAYRYNPGQNSLELVNPAALIYTAAKQDYVKNADILLVYVSNNPNREYGAMHAGSAYQNVGLYAASNGMSNVVLGMIDKDMLHKELHLQDDEYVIIAQAMGWPKTVK